MKGCTKQCGRFNSRFVFSLLSEGVERVFFFLKVNMGCGSLKYFVCGVSRSEKGEQRTQELTKPEAQTVRKES